jgi:hypothetical protein
MTTDPETDDNFDYNQETRYPHPLPQKGDKVFVKSVDSDRLDLERDFSGSSTYLDAYTWRPFGELTPIVLPLQGRIEFA